ncbi:uncharacterized protein LOC132249314 [Alligator mississippiensis]|uniref:uncharacterized protein LOC132249314 n=1 Tax=Alligator mississippiensis TaxID=8496 RepID=UPI002877F5C7|nr:uncharacterized protein LOC132249314 [Alligator mississippiensis]
MQLGDRDELVDFLVDTGAAHSVLTQKLKPLSKKTVPVVGVTGKAVTRSFLQPMTCNIGQAEVTHQFLYMPNCPVPLLGRDLLCKLQATLSFQDGQMFLTVPPEKGWHLQACLLGLLQEESTPDIPQPLLDAVVPWVWAGHRPGKAKNADPVKIQLLPGAQPPCVKQYPMRMEARKGLKPLVERFLEYGLLRECTSAFNTPILPVKKPKSNEYRFVQDLRAVNKVVVSIYPAVPNPYTLLSALNPDHNWFTVIDLKDAFFCILNFPFQHKAIHTGVWGNSRGHPEDSHGLGNCQSLEKFYNCYKMKNEAPVTLMNYGKLQVVVRVKEIITTVCASQQHLQGCVGKDL